MLIPATMNDPYKDLQDAIKNEIPEKYRDIIFDAHPLDVKSNPTVGDILNYYPG